MTHTESAGHFHQAGKGCCPHPDCVRATSPSGVLTESQIRNLQISLRTLGADNFELRFQNRLHRQKASGEYWAWTGDPVEDQIESLTCPVLVPAEQVRKWVAIQARSEQLLYEMSHGHTLVIKDSDGGLAINRLRESIEPKDHGRGPGGA